MPRSMTRPYQDDLLARHLRASLGEIDDATMSLLREHLEWVEIAAGQPLMTQGEAGDSMYLSVSGRLRAYVRGDDGRERLVREMARGQIIGEMSLYTDAPRSATVIAVRDSVLVRLTKPAFEALIARSAAVSVALTRQIIARLQSTQAGTALPRPVAIGLLPITSGVAADDIARRLAAQLQRLGRVCVVDAAALDAALGQPGLAHGAADAEAERRIALHLDELEARHDFVLLVGDDHPGPWTARCSRRSDELLLLADATATPALHPTETQILMQRPGRTEAAEVLVLLHPEHTPCPRGTRGWLARRPVADHVHVRPALERDMARLARLQSRTAVGLVLAGGGARGLAHLGLFRALCEHGIEIDAVGGTSIGAVMTALLASDRPVDTLVAIARRAFRVNPTGDVNLLPLLSLIRGRRLRRTVDAALHALLGFDADVEDLWKNSFCVASNYSLAREEVIAHGPLRQALLASTAIPGALPPVLRDGALLCDGGTFNNFPTDVMRARRGIGRVIGADLQASPPRRVPHDDVPGTWALLLDRLRRRRRYRLPTLLTYLMNVTILYSSSRRSGAKAQTDLYFNPPLHRVGLLQWNRFDSVVAQGYHHGDEVLGGLAPEALRALRPPVD